MRYLVSCERMDGESLGDYVNGRPEAGDTIAAVCLMHQLMGGTVVLLTERDSDPELHLDLYIDEEKVGHLSAVPVSADLN